VISVSVPCRSYLTLVGLLRMWTWRFQLLEFIIEMPLRGDTICTAKLKAQVTLASYLSFVSNFFVIHQNMVPAQWRNTSWQRTHHKIKRMNKGRSISDDWLNGRWNSVGYTEVKSKSRNFNRKVSMEIIVWHIDYSHINCDGRQNNINWLIRTLKLPNSTKPLEIATSH
jgi:hypothetical protein